jgi:hypothetical protein
MTTNTHALLVGADFNNTYYRALQLCMEIKLLKYATSVKVSFALNRHILASLLFSYMIMNLRISTFTCHCSSASNIGLHYNTGL